MGKSIQMNNNIYWSADGVVIDTRGTTLSSIFDANNKIQIGNLPVDQTYGATSDNPQSGKAVAQAIAAAITTVLGGNY
jgi:hypothetical protein